MISSKAGVLMTLREKQGEPVSGQLLAKKIGISRVAVWKSVQSLLECGYPIETSGSGYLIDPKKEKDFLYPWEFAEKENLFYHFKNTGSTMDRAREAAFRAASKNGAVSESVFTAEKQSAGRGRNGRTWVSRQGGLFLTILEKPKLSISDYSLFSLIAQIAVTRCITDICGKKAYIRWPNDIYIDRKKIAGITTEIAGEGDLLTWLTCGIGVNVNNPAPSRKAISCTEIKNANISRREVLNKILDEIEKVKKTFASNAAYSQGNRALASEWNSLSDCMGAKAAVFEPTPASEDENKEKRTGKILARGVFNGIDPVGRCILKTDDSTLYFNQGSVSLALLNP